MGYHNRRLVVLLRQLRSLEAKAEQAEVVQHRLYLNLLRQEERLLPTNGQVFSAAKRWVAQRPDEIRLTHIALRPIVGELDNGTAPLCDGLDTAA